MCFCPIFFQIDEHKTTRELECVFPHFLAKLMNIKQLEMEDGLEKQQTCQIDEPKADGDKG